MALVSTQSGLIASLEAGSLVASRNLGGYIESQVASATKASSDSTNSYYRMLRVHSSWRIAGLALLTAAWGTSGSINIGIYETVANGGALVSAASFASAVDVSAAIANLTDVVAEAVAPDQLGKQLWERLGLAADPSKFYDIVVSAANIGAAQAAAFALQVKYQR